MPDQSYTYSIRKPGDIKIFSKNCKTGYKVFQTQQIEVPFESSHIITSVKVTNKWNDGTGGYVSIKDGGVGFKHVRIGLTSQFGRGFDFDIEIWGRPQAFFGGRK